MKKLLAILCLIIMIFCFVGCASEKDSIVESINEDTCFVVIEEIGHYGDRYMYLVYDEKTKVEYIHTTGYNETSFCPYYDENGEVVIYKGE